MKHFEYDVVLDKMLAEDSSFTPTSGQKENLPAASDEVTESCRRGGE